MELAIHNITDVKVETHRGRRFTWVVLSFKDKYGSESELTLWPEKNKRSIIPFPDTQDTENVHANDNTVNVQETEHPF